ncbi:MAG TPA: glycerophosphodiester phosphodiesterase family protein [Rhizobacter sp.]|nr:glycerophosphodiester phosphodiesterase family protein [Rhizobacter sp.]
MTPASHRIRRLHEQAGSELLRIAHRGARAYAPENTLPAFEKAAQMGCHMVELDVHCSADGELVVHHDDDLQRCTDATSRFPGRSSYYVSDFSARDLATLDAGGWYLAQLALAPAQRQAFLRELAPSERTAFIGPGDERLFGSGEVKVPTLADVLELARPSGLLVNIELKTLPRMYPGIAAKALDCVAHFGLMERVLISSFDHEQLATVRSMNAQVATAVLTADRLSHVARYLAALDADAFHPGCYGNFDSLGFGSVDQRLETRGIDEVRAAGKGVNVWTCNDEAQMRALIEAGVTGLITDYPNRLSAVVRA